MTSASKSSLVWNMEETGATPGREFDAPSTTRRYLTLPRSGEIRVAEFKQLHLITMIPLVNAAEDYGLTLFVFKGRALPCRSVLTGSHVVGETYADHLPRNAVISTQVDRGGVDSDNILKWANMFVARQRYVGGWAQGGGDL